MQPLVEAPDRSLNAAFAAVEAGAWADAMRYAGSVLAQNPLDPGAFEIISIARRALESAREGGAERRQMTILFADVAGSTTLLNQLGGEVYRDFMLELHQAAAKAVSRFGGRIAQYLGDGILAYFSYPQAHEDDAQRAIYAALDLLERLEAATPVLKARFGQRSSLRVGIDTGRVVIGTAGAGQWTTVDAVFGDAAHVAARLQALASANSVLISDATHQLVERDFTFESLGPQLLSGYPAPIAVHRVVGRGRLTRPDTMLPTMVGRESEATELEQLWASVRSGEQAELLITGEAGIGKSRLVEHLANVAIATGGRVMAFNCSEAFQHSALYPVATTLRRLLLGSTGGSLTDEAMAKALESAGVRAELVGRAVVPLANLLDDTRSVDVLPQQLRAALFELIVELLQRLASAEPLLLTIEDLHRADASTLQLLKAIRSSKSAGILVLATQRSPAVEGDWNRLLQLTPLPPSSARVLVLRSAPELDTPRVDAVLAGSAGLPLFLIDAARSMSAGASALASPSATTALLTHRLDQLDEDTRLLVADISVLGVAAGFPLLAAVSELPTERLERALARLLHIELLVAHSTDEGSSFQFQHPLYRELAYDRQLLGARKRRHSRCADALLSSAEGSVRAPLPEIIAHHFVSAGRADESIPHWQAAGDRAAAAAAHTEAISHYQCALSAIGALGPSAELAMLELVLQLSKAASCAAVHGYADERSLQAYTRAASIAAATPDAAVPLPALWGIWASYLVRGAHGEGLDLMRRCLAVADAAHSSELRAVAAAITGSQFVYVGRWDEAELELQQAVNATGPATQVFPQDPALASRALLAVVRCVRGAEAAGILERDAAVSAARQLTGRQAEFTRAYVFCFAAWCAQLVDDAPTAIGLAQEAIAISQRNNFETWLGAGALHVAAALTELGDFDTGLPLFEQALTGWRAAGAELMVPYFLGRYGRALIRRGRVEEGLLKLREALTVAETGGEVFYKAELHRLISEGLASSGAAPDEIRRELASAVSVATSQGATTFALRANRALSEAPA
jgi:class 3 adenylate cyclase